jgi:hypothetical protein
MPLSKYFKGKGEKVMHNMEEIYGGKKGKEVFYATAKKNKMEPSKEMKRKHGVK